MGRVSMMFAWSFFCTGDCGIARTIPQLERYLLLGMVGTYLGNYLHTSH